jgi:hypothetical protein
MSHWAIPRCGGALLGIRRSPIEQEHGLESGTKATARTVSRLVFEMCDGLQRADDALLALAEFEVFAHQHDSLHDDAEQLRELRGDMLEYIMGTWQDVESHEAQDLRVKRRVREQLAREADEASLAKHRRGQ